MYEYRLMIVGVCQRLGVQFSNYNFNTQLIMLYIIIILVAVFILLPFVTSISCLAELMLYDAFRHLKYRELYKVKKLFKLSYTVFILSAITFLLILICLQYYKYLWQAVFLRLPLTTQAIFHAGLQRKPDNEQNLLLTTKAQITHVCPA